MNKIIKYNLEIMTCTFMIIILYGLINLDKLSLVRQMIIVFMGLYTLHEWEESRFPGGFYRIFFSKCTINSNISEEEMHFPVAIYLLIILTLPFVLDGVYMFALVPLLLALFEGFIHTAGIVIHKLKKPYSPGMITAWIMFVYAIIMIGILNRELSLDAKTWILGGILTIISFLIMESNFMKGVGITIKDFQKSMKSYMLDRIKGKV